jgi:hypothetical protein
VGDGGVGGEDRQALHPGLSLGDQQPVKGSPGGGERCRVPPHAHSTSIGSKPHFSIARSTFSIASLETLQTTPMIEPRPVTPPPLPSSGAMRPSGSERLPGCV